MIMFQCSDWIKLNSIPDIYCNKIGIKDKSNKLNGGLKKQLPTLTVTLSPWAVWQWLDPRAGLKTEYLTQGDSFYSPAANEKETQDEH